MTNHLIILNDKGLRHEKTCVRDTYHLWDPVSSHVFNSFHVSFAEHLDTLDTLPFHPGTVLGTATASYPPSWDVSGPAPPKSVAPTQCLHNYNTFFSPLLLSLINHPFQPIFLPLRYHQI
jgi:hypothetical protein